MNFFKPVMASSLVLLFAACTKKPEQAVLPAGPVTDTFRTSVKSIHTFYIDLGRETDTAISLGGDIYLLEPLQGFATGKTQFLARTESDANTFEAHIKRLVITLPDERRVKLSFFKFLFKYV